MNQPKADTHEHLLIMVRLRSILNCSKNYHRVNQPNADTHKYFLLWLDFSQV